MSAGQGQHPQRPQHPRTPILLLGADGQVGWQLQRALAPLGEVTALTIDDCNFEQPESLRAAVDRVQPRYIVNAAAYTAVDKAETDVARARQVNAEAVGVLATAARAIDAYMVHYSTDYVYAGDKSGAYVESDPTGPVSVYGQTKLEGELAMQAAGCRGVIFRTSWVFGARGHNFVKTILRLAADRERLTVVADQIGCPTPAALIATVTGQVLGAVKRRHGASASGVETYHLASSRAVSWQQFAQTIVATAQRTPGFALRCTPEQILPITTAEYPTPAQRPANSELDCSRLEAAYGLEMPDWQPYLERMMQLLALKSANGY